MTEEERAALARELRESIERIVERPRPKRPRHKGNREGNDVSLLGKSTMSVAKDTVIKAMQNYLNEHCFRDGAAPKITDLKMESNSYGNSQNTMTIELEQQEGQK